MYFLSISSRGHAQKQFGRINHFYLPKLNDHQPDAFYDSIMISNLFF